MNDLLQKTKENWTCPVCKIEMKDLEELIDMKGLDYQEMPGVFWCQRCGTLRDSHSPKKHTHIPELAEGKA